MAANLCPHCAQARIPLWRKINATVLFPVRCRKCGGRSFVSAWSHFGICSSAEILRCGSITAAIYWKSWPVLLFYPSGLILLFTFFCLRSPLIAATPQRTAAGRRNAVFLILGGLALILLLQALL